MKMHTKFLQLIASTDLTIGMRNLKGSLILEGLEVKVEGHVRR
jgi:hypothetical protein